MGLLMSTDLIMQQPLYLFTLLWNLIVSHFFCGCVWMHLYSLVDGMFGHLGWFRNWKFIVLDMLFRVFEVVEIFQFGKILPLSPLEE